MVCPSSKLDIPKERYTYELLSRLIRDGQGSGEVDAAMAAEDIVQELMLFARGVVLDGSTKTAITISGKRCLTSCRACCLSTCRSTNLFAV